MPVLEGALADRAQAAILEVAEDLLRREELTWLRKIGPSLAEGWAGLALLFAYLDRTGLLPGASDHAGRCLDRAAEELATRPSDPTLATGFTGVAWVEAHLQRLYGEADEGEGEVDAALERLHARQPWQYPFDLMHGLSGHGVYFLERLPDEGSLRRLEAVVEILAELARRGPRGISWFTPPGLVFDSMKEECPDGCFNLGMAHGGPGVVALLARALLAGAHPETCRELLEGAVPWLLAQRMPRQSGMAFCSYAVPGRWFGPSRVAWCYGDPGVALAILSAARALGHGAWESEALDIARAAAQRPFETSVVFDACLCHGAAGAGHLFSRLFQATGEEIFREAAQAWYERALSFRQEGGIGGFRYHTSDPGRPEVSIWHDKAGFLEGSAGIALALLAAISDLEPAWDTCLLTSIPTSCPSEQAASTFSR